MIMNKLDVEKLRDFLSFGRSHLTAIHSRVRQDKSFNPSEARTAEDWLYGTAPDRKEYFVIRIKPAFCPMRHAKAAFLALKLCISETRCIIL